MGPELSPGPGGAVPTIQGEAERQERDQQSPQTDWPFGLEGESAMGF